MQQLAIIGTGIAGMGCAHFLQRDFELTIFEQGDDAGGHTHTEYVEEDGKQIPIDTGFIVCNQINYPLLMKLFHELQVPLKKTKMSFAAQIVHDRIEYCGSSLKLLFAQRKNLFSPRYIRFLYQLNQFNKECLEVEEKKEFHVLSVRAYIRKKKWSNDLLNWYLLPMSSALWSTPPETSARFPILSLVRFFRNHGFLGLNTQFQWYTVDGGSEEYKKRLIEPFKNKIRTNAKVEKVMRGEKGVAVQLKNGEEFLFDKVIIATHADQALKILSDPTAEEISTLTPFKYQTNRVTLHTDEQVMPTLKKVWSSWNFRTEKRKEGLISSCNYWMNSLQDVSEKKNYFVSINDPGLIANEKILREFTYEHPVFTVEAMQQQDLIQSINGGSEVYFCGSYFKYGFHEDAFRSAVQICEQILGRAIWQQEHK